MRLSFLGALARGALGEGDAVCRSGRCSSGGSDSQDIAALRAPLADNSDAAVLTVHHSEIEDRLRFVLDSHGVAIVTGIANAAEVRGLTAKFRKDLTEVIDIAAAEAAGGAVASTAAQVHRDEWQWPLASMAGLGRGTPGFCRDRGLPHGSFPWAARLLPALRRTYEVLYNSSDLVTSIDNAIFSPSAVRATEVDTSWPHADQNYHDPQAGHWPTFQGLLYLHNSSAETGTTVVWPGSHKSVYHEIMDNSHMRDMGRAQQHFTPMPMRFDLHVRWRKGARRLQVPAGALLLWNSRMVHQGWTGPRLAQPVCWEPRERRDRFARERKLRLAVLGLPSSHWASLGQLHPLLGSAPQPLRAVHAHSSRRDVRLPLKPSIRPLPLVASCGIPDGAWEAAWDRPLPPALLKRLEECIHEEFKTVL